MMNSKWRKFKDLCQLFGIAVGLFFAINLHGQDLCVQNLEQAQRNFNEGQFYSIESLLAPCIKNGFNRQERIQAIELLALTKLYLDELDEADSLYLSLLRIDPEHQVNKVLDPPDLIFLHESFRTDALFLWSLIIGGNVNSPWVIHDYSVFANNEYEENYVIAGGFEMGVGFEINVRKKFYVGLEALYSLKRFISTGSALERTYEFRYLDVSHWINIPVYAKYYFGEGKWSYYGYLGPQTDYLLINRLNNLTKTPFSDPQTETDLDETYRRHRLNFSLAFGGGIRYKTNGISLFILDMKVNPGLTNLVDESQRYSDQTSTIFFGNVDDAYRMNAVTLTLRFMQPYYRPKKLKQFGR